MYYVLFPRQAWLLKYQTCLSFNVYLDKLVSKTVWVVITNLILGTFYPPDTAKDCRQIIAIYPCKFYSFILKHRYVRYYFIIGAGSYNNISNVLIIVLRRLSRFSKNRMWWNLERQNITWWVIHGVNKAATRFPSSGWRNFSHERKKMQS